MRRRRGEELGEGGERGRTSQAAVILLVILSGSLETRALLRLLSVDKVKNKRTDFPPLPPQLVMLLCHEQSSAFTFPSVFFLTFPVCHETETKVPSSSPSWSLQFGPSLSSKRQCLEFWPACPLSLHPSLLSSALANLFRLSSLPIVILERYSSFFLLLPSSNVTSLLVFSLSMTDR